MIKLESELATLRTEDSHLESTLEVLKRTRLRESFSIQFAAQKELGEKMALLAEYGDLLVKEMENASAAEKEGVPYEGEEATSLIVTRATEALHTWTPASTARRETDLKTAETSESQEVAGASDLHRAKTMCVAYFLDVNRRGGVLTSFTLRNPVLSEQRTLLSSPNSPLSP